MAVEGSSKTVWYALRRGLNARTDEDIAMAHERLGPFDDRQTAYDTLRQRFKDGVNAALQSRPGSTAHLFGDQYLQLLWLMLRYPDEDSWTWRGVRWSLGSVTIQVQDEQERAWSDR